MNRDFIELLAVFNARAVEHATPGTVFQIGVPPPRVDVITAIDGVDFEDAWPDRVAVRLDDTTVPVLSRHHLIANKKASGRLQDLADVERLEDSRG